MGGGASSMSGPLEQLLITTMMIGRAIAAISCPGMYTIYDFHSPKAPRLKLNGHLANNPFAILQQGYNDDDDDDDEVESNKRKNPEVYNKMFTVQVGEDKIYIENVLHSNESGWLPLHACCMSLVTLDAGLRIIDEMLLQERQQQHNSGDEKKDSLSSSSDNTTITTLTTINATVNYLDLPTINGPGAFNSQWTPLHMASAYGVEPLVTRLLEEGVNVNTQNSYGYTPLLESCRRGYIGIVQRLLGDSYLDVNHLPSSDLACESPFSTAPPQRPLAESTRAGFITVVQLLLDDERVQTNASNSIGWTALHEACFYNRKEIVQLLLLKAADPTARTAMSDAMPYHLTSDNTIRDMLKTLGGSLAVPTDTDKIDMLTVLEELASFKNAKNNYNNNSNSSGYNNSNSVNSYGSNKNKFGSSSKKYNNRQMVVYNSGNNNDNDDEGDDRDTTVTITNMLLNQSLSSNNNSNSNNNTTVQYIISIGGGASDDGDYNNSSNNNNDEDDNVDTGFKKVEFSQAYLANKRATTNSNNSANGNTTVVDDYRQYMNDTPPSSSSGRGNNNHNSNNTVTNNHRDYSAAEVPHTRNVTSTSVNNSSTTTANTTNNNNSNSSRSKSTSLLGALPVLSTVSPKNNITNKTNHNGTTAAESSQSVSLTADAKPFTKRMYHPNSNNSNNNANNDGANTHLISRIDTSHMNNNNNSNSNNHQVPKSFVCELSHKIMTDPVQSIYGNIFERSLIAQWIEIHGKICPLTGAPLCITDLTTCQQLAQDIRQYLLQRATTGADVAINSNSGNRQKQDDGKIDDDLYSF